eukprot:1141948-Pelagomonas_calceolata.AAC.3
MTILRFSSLTCQLIRRQQRRTSRVALMVVASLGGPRGGPATTVETCAGVDQIADGLHLSFLWICCQATLKTVKG